MNKYYIVPVFGCVDPEPLAGPFKTYKGMVRAARKLHAKQAEEDAIFWLRCGKGRPTVGSFTNDEIGGD